MNYGKYFSYYVWNFSIKSHSRKACMGLQDIEREAGRRWEDGEFMDVHSIRFPGSIWGRCRCFLRRDGPWKKRGVCAGIGWHQQP